MLPCRQCDRMWPRTLRQRSTNETLSQGNMTGSKIEQTYGGIAGKAERLERFSDCCNSHKSVKDHWIL